jgi:peptidoglycan/xylan/chitin deacetylase (PgdA/CDA1 family)
MKKSRSSRWLIGLAALAMSVAPVATTALAQDKADDRAAGKSGGEVCITFDELPASKSFGDVDKGAVTYLLLEALKKHNVKATGFVVGEYIEEGYDLLGRWLNGGHSLGNLTFSYQDYNELDPENFISEIMSGNVALESMLTDFGQARRYFRYPYLHYGSTIVAKKAAREYLEANNIVVAHVSVTLDDYLYNLTLEKMGKVPDTAKYAALKKDYLSHVIGQLERSERLSREILKRPCRHILELRANRLNAVFLDDILTAIERRGYKFISLEEALKDALYSMPEAYFGWRGVGYLEMVDQSNPDLLPAK